MGFFKWLYGLPGRIDRSFSATAVAADAEGPGAGVNQLNVPAARIVTQEIENATTGKREEHEDDPAA